MNEIKIKINEVDLSCYFEEDSKNQIVNNQCEKNLTSCHKLVILKRLNCYYRPLNNFCYISNGKSLALIQKSDAIKGGVKQHQSYKEIHPNVWMHV